jgi:YwiC-like protein
MTDQSPRTRSALRSVAVPTEHGGWGLTLEPAVLGLLVAPSVAGLCLAAGAITAFVLRTPLKIVLVDRHRTRRLPRTRVAERVAAVEAVILGALVAAAIASAAEPFWMPAAIALPLVALELWFDMRSRSRRLVPELAGAIGVSAVVAMIVLADGAGGGLAAALWLVLAGRVVTSVPWVRAQIERFHGHAASAAALAIADVAAIVLVAAAVVLDDAVVGGAVAVLLVIAVQRIVATRSAARPKVLGVIESVFGIAVVVATALNV